MHPATPEAGDRFFDARWPEARAVSDEKGELYRAFGLKRGSVGQVAGPKVWLPGLRALLEHGVGKPEGDPMLLSGWFLLDGGGVAWEQRHASSGETRQWAELERAWREVRGGRG